MCVIGAGPVGLAVAKALGERGEPYVQLEATDHVGGNWAHGVYETAHIISSRRTTEYPDWPMPQDYPDFPSASQMCSYYNAFADRFGLREKIRFGQTVTSVRQEGGLWRVTTEQGLSSLFRGVIVCNGHHWERFFPPWAKDFSGTLLHSKDYKRPDQLAGRRVLVVGGGNSGCDLACEAARVATRADWSLRRGYWFLPKTVLGRPTVELMRGWIPVPAQRAVLKRLIRLVIGRYEDYGLPTPDHEMFEEHPTVSSEIFHYLAHGRVKPRPDVQSVEGQTVRFADGTEDRYDVIACGTGFDLSFPFLEPGVVPIEGKRALLYGGMMSPTWRHLWIVGTTQPRYGLGPLIRPAAEVLVDLIRLQDETAVPLGRVLRDMGQQVEPSHLQDPHEVLRRIRHARWMLPILRWRVRRMAVPA
jgi:cation diffusion facilitator CzcD-associated flavoprotein CzcO